LEGEIERPAILRGDQGSPSRGDAKVGGQATLNCNIPHFTVDSSPPMASLEISRPKGGCRYSPWAGADP